MARKLRLEFPGAIYHVINRGNYRAWIFKDEKAKAAFESCVVAACAKSGWLLHAFVIMGNHYHLAVETPHGNLVAGMQWLQSTFANRFNKLRGERGHLFQGRYQALLVEEGEALGQVCHYIHLNPVRAGIVPVERLAAYRHSSYWYLRRPKQRPPCLQFTDALLAAGGLPDNRAGWNRYAAYLAWAAEAGPAGRNKAYVNLSRGWALGGQAFKKALREDHAVAQEARAWESAGVKEVRAARWEEALERALGAVPVQERQDKKKSAPWKVAVAAHLKATTDVANGWLAERLDMGSHVYVSKHVGLLRQQAGSARRWLERLDKVKGKA
jgi:putative transposase